MIGRTLLHYQVLEKLGEGGMGAVYKARDTHLGRFVALKVLHKTPLAAPDQRQRFFNEARAASALNHPNIIHIYDIGNDDGVDFITMEFVSGKTLMELIRKKGLSLAKTLKYAIQVADALTKAHAAGIIHRDLKPSNIMVNDDGSVKLVDFGLAKLVEPLGSSDNVMTVTVGEAVTPTKDGVIVGTASYMAPEQAEGKAVDARTDVFSFGAVLYEMVGGQRAFPGDSPASMLVAVMTKDPPSLQSAPREIDKVIQRCLRKNPAERWHSMADVKMALEDLYSDYSTGSAELLRVRRSERRLAKSAGLIVLIAVVLAAAMLLAPRFSGTEDAPDISPRLLTSTAGSERNPSISPDGSQVAFSWNGPNQDNYDIYIQHISSSTLLRLTDDPAEDDHPAWSPDGRWIAFHRHGGGRRMTLNIISPLGGPARKIAEDDLNSGLSWTPDGKWLLLPVRLSLDTQRGIFLLSVETGERRRLTAAPPESRGDSDAAISPNGSALAFVRGIGNHAAELYVARLGADFQPKGEPKRITLPAQWNCHNPVWTPDGRDLIFSGGTPGNHSLWRVSANGSRPPRRLAFAGDVGYADLTISRPTLSAASRLIYSRRLDDSNIWQLDLMDKASPAKPLISSTRPDMHARYSPDGTRVAFESSRAGDMDVWVSNADGSNPLRLTTTAAYCGSPSWSPDGRRIAFESNSDGHWSIYTMDASGENRRRMTSGSNTNAVPMFSRDGKWIYFASRSNTIYQIWRMPADGGPAVQVTRNGGYMAMESADGKYLFYTLDGGNPTSLWRRSLETGEETEITFPILRDSFFPVKDGIYLVGEGKQRTLEFFSFKSGRSVAVRVFDRAPAPGLTVSPDGAHLLFSQLDQSGSDLMLADDVR